MKLTATLIRVMVFYLLSTVVQSEPTSQYNTQSIDEVQNWIKDQILKHASYEQMSVMGNEVYKVEALSFEGCTIKYRALRKTEGRAIRFNRNRTLSLSDVDPSRVTVEKELWHYWLKLRTYDDKREIMINDTTSIKGQEAERPMTTGKSNTCSIGFKDANVAEQVAKALKLAAELCKSRKGN
jgi:hypothetical protein